ncbi:MAG TPA: M3 family metallopeptidase, partial [Candidatus Krumholzibacteria bacterium]|nr:M3 family metallopeptidase [Candidatus Krumholzibacteria bacterium]
MTTMRKVLLTMTIASALAGAAGANPLLEPWTAPFGVPPFDRIAISDYEPAFAAAIAEHEAEIAAIVGNPEAPTFANTIEALDAAGASLDRVSSVFFGLNGTMTDEAMQKVAKTMAPILSRHRDAVALDEGLFRRVDAVWQARAGLALDTEQAKLLEETWKGFVRGGANLDPEAKDQLRAVNEELSLLQVQFGENVLKETNRWELVIADRADLAGLPQGVIDAAAEDAAARGHQGQWVITLQKPSFIPFLQYARNRGLREQVFKAYAGMCDHDDDLDNKAVLVKIADLRARRARLLGFPTHAHYVLDDNMARTPEAVYALLQKVWEPAVGRAKEEVAEMQAIIDAEGGGFSLEPWDWWYYAEKVKKARYDLDEDMLRPYFEMGKVRAGVFATAGRLYGLTFTPRNDIPVWHPDVEAFEVTDATGATVALLLTDYYPRASKRGGAWMNALIKERYQDGQRVVPVIYNVGNFTKPTKDTPSLLSMDEVGTMFHEFGHALHGMLSDCRYETLSGTSVARDFVELPSQIMENWAFEPQVLDMYARHYRTGEPMPAGLKAKISDSKHFNQGFATTEYVAASFLDMDWHTLASAEGLDARAFEDASMAKIGLIPQVISRYKSPYFRHSFGGGYSAGYYSYLWAEVLDADAFEAFKETGDIFDPKTAAAFRDNILERGGTEDPMVLYR